MKKIFKNYVQPMISAVLVFVVVLGFHLNAFASASIIADDSTSRTGSTGMFPSTGFNSHIYNERQYDGSSSYQTPAGGYYFSWNAPISYSGTMNVQVYAYLRSDLFNNTEAQYYCDVERTDTYIPLRGEIGIPLNQNTAAVGWNMVGETSFSGWYFHGVSVKSSDTKNTGADAIMIVYWES